MFLSGTVFTSSRKLRNSRGWRWLAGIHVAIRGTAVGVLLIAVGILSASAAPSRSPSPVADAYENAMRFDQTGDAVLAVVGPGILVVMAGLIAALVLFARHRHDSRTGARPARKHSRS